MLHINDLTYRIQGKTILEHATAAIPPGHKVGLVGRNGTGKTTLLRLITGELSADDGAISYPRNVRLGQVAQEAPGGPDTLVEWVLASDRERAQLLSEAQTATDPDRIAEIQLRLTDIDAHTAPARAAQILSGLGFDEQAQHRPCSEYSGGWRMRVALAAVLLVEPEILLLDEPTNYLDLEGTLWLESYLKAYPHTVLIVSHDRDLLNRVAGHILHLSERKLTLYTGGYDTFEETRRETQRLQLKLKKKQDEERKRIEAFVTRFKAKATKATQAQSRVKALARMKPIAASIDDRVTPFFMPAPERQLASPLIRLDRASVGYDADKPILTNLDLRLDHDDRIALLGANGNGKSTFAKLLSGRLAPLSGEVVKAPKLAVGYFAQHQLDDLNPDARPYDYVVKLMPEASEAQRRTRLGAFGFGADKVDTRCQNLSGGEKARLLLALTAFHAPHLLILDEPTNHLDVDSREALIHALNEFDGAVIIISHDRHLLEATVDRLWVVRDGTVSVYDADLDGYRRELLSSRSNRPASIAANAQTGAPDAPGPSRTDRSEQRRIAAEQRSNLAPLKKAVTAVEKRLDAINRDIAKLDAILADPAIYQTNPAKAQDAAVKRGQLSRMLADAEEEWLAASDALEQASALTG